MEGLTPYTMSRPYFAFLIEKLSTRAEVVHFIAKWRMTVFLLNCFGLICLAIYPPSIITTHVRPPSASTDFFNFSETRACSLHGYSAIHDSSPTPFSKPYTIQYWSWQQRVALRNSQAKGSPPHPWDRRPALPLFETKLRHQQIVNALL